MRTTIATVTLVLLVASAAFAAEEVRVNPPLAEGAPVRGAWRVVQIPEEGGPPPFQMLMVFTRDGGVVETDAGPPNPLQFSPGIGEWKVDGDHYVASYTQLQYDDHQNQIGTFNARIDVTLNEKNNAFGGTVRVRFYDLNDELLFEGNGTVEGKRLSIE